MSGVAVFGAGGFVGSAVMRALAHSSGFSPIACVRRAPDAAISAPIRLCDATDRRAVAEALRGADCAVNAVLGDSRTMLDATRNICDAAREAGLRRLVHVSTASVYGAADGVACEEAALDGTGGYAAAKIGCEAIVRDFMAQGGEAVILRPGIVYGPGSQQWVGRLGRMLRAGRLGDLGVAGDGFCNLIYHDDVGAAVVASLAAADASGHAINLAPISPPTWNDVLIRFGCAIGATPVPRITGRRLRMETRVLAPPLQIAKLVASRAGLRAGALAEPIPPSLLALFGQRLRLDGARAQSLLGLVRTPFDQALAACSGWFGTYAA